MRLSLRHTRIYNGSMFNVEYYCKKNNPLSSSVQSFTPIYRFLDSVDISYENNFNLTCVINSHGCTFCSFHYKFICILSHMFTKTMKRKVSEVKSNEYKLKSFINI